MARPLAKLAEVLAAFRGGGGAGKPVKVQASLAWAPTNAEARDGAWAQWRGNVVGGDVLATLRTCADFEAAAQFVTPDDVAGYLPVSHDPLEHAERLQEYVDAGATDIYLFNVAPHAARVHRGVRRAGATGGARPTMIEDRWYKNAVIYSLEVETFLDANGDGIGDIEGLIRRLEYLQYLGVDAIWLAPFHPSPNRDNGYDVSDHYGVHPRYGSSGDFVELVHQARKHGLRVLMDLVVNHTSDEHPWFKEARAGRNSARRSWYVWSKKRPKHWDKGMVFPGVQARTWTFDRKSREYFFHRFFEFQPDLNSTSPEVRREMCRIMGFWLELGVCGFRVDALPFIIEEVLPDKTKHPQHFEYLNELRQFVQWRKGDAVLLGEANVLPRDTLPFFGEDGDRIHMMFNFFVNQHLFYALATHDIGPLVEALQATLDIPPTAQWAHFLRNHDELDLGRLTDKQRERVFARFAPDERMRLYGRGIRRRLAPMLGDREHEELAYSVLVLAPRLAGDPLW